MRVEDEGNKSLSTPIIVIGGGGHAKVLISTLLLQNRRIIGYVDLNSAQHSLLGIERLGDDNAVFQHSPAEVQLVNGVGSIGSTQLRRSLFEKFNAKGFSFAGVIHPAAFVAREVDLENGVQIMAGAVVQPGTWLGKNVIVNTGASVDHDCIIEGHAHIAPGVTLSGGVSVGEGSQIGTGASVIQGIRIGSRSIIGAGAVVIDDVAEGVTVGGVPAVVLRERTLVR